MIQNKGVELDDLGSLSHLKVYSWPPAWGWGRRGEGKPEIGGLQRSWRASPSSLRPALHPALALNLRPLLSFPHPGSSPMQRRVMRVGSGQSQEEAQTGATLADITPFSTQNYSL